MPPPRKKQQATRASEPLAVIPDATVAPVPAGGGEADAAAAEEPAAEAAEEPAAVEPEVTPREPSARRRNTVSHCGC